MHKLEQYIYYYFIILNSYYNIQQIILLYQDYFCNMQTLMDFLFKT